MTTTAAERWRPSGTAQSPKARQIGRTIDLTWRRTSYSALTAAAHDAYLSSYTSDPDEPPLAEDAFPPEPVDDSELPLGSGATGPSQLLEVSPMAALPGGVAFGSLVHAVFETFDPGATEARDSLSAIVAQQSARMPVAGVTVDELTTALLPGLVTPLGDLTGGRTLSDIAASDRLAELDFELPLGRGFVGAKLGDVGQLLRRHLRPTDPLISYADALDDPVLGDDQLRGFLTGSIDAVLRVDGRYVVVDYKTNRLAPPGVELTLGHYTAKSMAKAMIESHYPLQALLYAVALHRMLRWRQPGYDAERHLGGIGYLFVRGMAGSTTPVVDGMPTGVFSWHPPAGLVTALSNLLAGGEDPA